MITHVCAHTYTHTHEYAHVHTHEHTYHIIISVYLSAFCVLTISKVRLLARCLGYWWVPYPGSSSRCPDRCSLLVHVETDNYVLHTENIPIVKDYRLPIPFAFSKLNTLIPVSLFIHTIFWFRLLNCMHFRSSLWCYILTWRSRKITVQQRWKRLCL